MFFLRSSRLTIKQTTRLLPTTTSNPSYFRAFRNSVAKMGVHNVESKAQFDQVLKDHPVVVMDAFATWCGPCKVIAPEVVKHSEAYPNAHFIKVDVDEVPEVAQELGIRAMPTFLVFKNGEKVEEVVGANKVALEAAVKKHHPESEEKSEV